MREELLDRVRAAAALCDKKFADHTHDARFEDVKDVLALLNQLRVATVHLVECIAKWKAHVKEEHLSAVSNDANETESDDGRKWVVRLAVPGQQLYDASPAFTSSHKRYNRGALSPKRATTWLYVGKYRTRVEAETAYDEACVHESTKLGCLPSQLPPKVFYIRPCGKHNVIESKTEAVPRTVCEECALVALREAPEYSPSWTLNGQNYLLKTLSDLAFLERCEALVSFLPPTFSFRNNALLLHARDESYVKDMQKPSTAPISPTRGPVFGEFNVQVQSYADGIMEMGGTAFRGPRVNRGAGSPTALLQPATLENSDLTLMDGTQTVGQNVLVLTSQRIQRCLDILEEEKDVNATVAPIGDADSKDSDSDDNLESPTSRGGMTIVPFTKTAYIQDHTGATLEVQQRRTVHVPANGDRRFCDYAQGPYKSLRVRGRHSKKIAYKRDAAAKGQARLDERKTVLRRLKRAIRDEDEDRLPQLIAYAEKVAQPNGPIEATIAMAKKFLYDQQRKRDAAALWQRVFRGCLARRAARALAASLSHTSSDLGAHMAAVGKVVPNFVDNMLRAAVRKTAKRVRRREHIQVQEMDTEHCIVTVYDRHHADYFKRRGPPCASCRRANHVLRRRMRVAEARYVLAPGPCTCCWARPMERLAFRAYNPITKAVYTFDASSQEMCQQIIWIAENGHLPREHVLTLDLNITNLYKKLFASQTNWNTIDDLLATVCYAVTRRSPSESSRMSASNILPTDDVLRYGDSSSRRAIRERQYFEPIWENRVLSGVVDGLRRQATSTDKAADVLRHKFKVMSEQVEAARKWSEAAHHGFVVAKSNWVRSVVNKTTLIRLADEAMFFSKNTLAAYDDESASGSRQQQTYDPKEDASTFVYLKQKRDAVKEEVRRRKILQAALTQAQEAFSDWRLLVGRSEQLRDRLDRCLSRQHQLVADVDRHTALLGLAKQLKDRALKLFISRLTLRTKATVPLKRILLYDDPNWYLPRPRLPSALTGAAAKDGESESAVSTSGSKMDHWLRMVSPGWNACYRSSQALETQTFRQWERVRRGRYFVTVLWSRMEQNTSMAEDLVIEAYDPRRNKTQRILLVQREIQLLLLRDMSPPWLRKRWPELYKPVDTSGLFVEQQRNSQRAHMNIVDTIMKLVRLNAHDGRLECGKIRWWRSRQTLLTKLRYGCRWWHDIRQQKTSTKGWQVYHEGRRIGKRRCYVTVFENWGDLTIEAYDVRKNKFNDVYIPQAVVADSLASVSPTLFEVWTLSVKSGRYARSLMQAIVDRLYFQSLNPESRKPDERVLSKQEREEVAEHVVRSIGLSFKYCSSPSCRRGRLPIVEFIDHVGRINHLCQRCFGVSAPRRVNHGFSVLVFRRRERQTYTLALSQRHPVNRVLFDINIQANNRGDLIINAKSLPTEIVDNKTYRIKSQTSDENDGSDSGDDSQTPSQDVRVTHTESVAVRPIRIARPVLREVFSDNLRVLRKGNETEFWATLLDYLALRTLHSEDRVAALIGPKPPTDQGPLQPSSILDTVETRRVTILPEQTQLVLSRRAAGREHALLKWRGCLHISDDEPISAENFWHGQIHVEVHSPCKGREVDEYTISVRREALHEWERRSRQLEMCHMSQEETHSRAAWKLQEAIEAQRHRALKMVRQAIQRHSLQQFVRQAAFYFRSLYQQWRQRTMAVAESICHHAGLAVVDGCVAVPVELQFGVTQTTKRRLLRKSAILSVTRQLQQVDVDGASSVQAEIHAFKIQRVVHVQICIAGDSFCVDVDAERMYGQRAQRETEEKHLVEEAIRHAEWQFADVPILSPPKEMEASLFWHSDATLSDKIDSTIPNLSRSEALDRWQKKNGLRLWSTRAHVEKGFRRCLTKLWSDEDVVWIESNLYHRRTGSQTCIFTVQRTTLSRLLGRDTGTSSKLKHVATSYFKLQVGTKVIVFSQSDSVDDIDFRGTIVRVNEDNTLGIISDSGASKETVPRRYVALDTDSPTSQNGVPDVNSSAHSVGDVDQVATRIDATATSKVQSKEERAMRRKLATALEKLNDARLVAFEKADKVDSTSNNKAMGSLFIPVSARKAVQGLNLTPSTWQRALPQLLGDAKAITRVVIQGCAFFFQKDKATNVRAIEVCTKLGQGQDSAQITGDCVVMRQGGTRAMQEIIFHYKQEKLMSQFKSALAAMEAQRVAAEEASLAPQPETQQADGAEKSQSEQSSQAAKDAASRAPSAKPIGSGKNNRPAKYSVQWRVDMRKRTSLFKQLVPGTRAIVEALPLQRVRRLPLATPRHFPVQGEIVHYVMGEDEAVFAATVLRYVKPRASLHGGDHCFELLLANGVTVVSPVSKIARLPRIQEFRVKASTLIDLVVSKIATRPHFALPSERQLLSIFFAEQLRIRPQPGFPVAVSTDVNRTPQNWESYVVKQHVDSATSAVLRVLHFRGFGIGPGMDEQSAATQSQNALQLEVNHTRWQRPVLRSGKIYMLQGFYDGSSVLLNLHNPRTNECLRLLLSKYDVQDRTGLSAPVSSTDLADFFRSCASSLQLFKVNNNTAHAYSTICIGLKDMDWLDPRWALAAFDKLASQIRAQDSANQLQADIARSRQVLCRRARVRRSWFLLEQKRRLHERFLWPVGCNHSRPSVGDAITPPDEPRGDAVIFQEWQQMRMADQESAHIRPYLTIPHSQLQELHATFSHFDKDGNNEINATEFQDMIYEVKGEVLDKAGVAAALREIDRDGNGVVDFNEFVWWFVNPRSQYPTSSGLAGFFLKLQLDIKKNSRAWKRKAEREQADAREKRKAREIAISQVLRARKAAVALKQHVAKIEKAARDKIGQERKKLEARRSAARTRAIAALKRSREMAALETPEEREAYRLAHLTDEERAKEDALKEIERARQREAIEAKEAIEHARVAREMLEAQERREREKLEAEAQKRREEIELAKQKLAEHRARKQREEEEQEAELQRQLAAQEAAKKAEEEKAAKQAEEAAAMEAERLAMREQALKTMTDEERARSNKREKELQLQRLGEQKMAKQLEAEKVMQKKLERADRARRRAEKAKKKAAKSKLKKKKSSSPRKSK